MPPVPPREQIEAWLAQGARDLEVAEALFGQGFHDACALYSQQSVEKYLKAFYMATKKREAPKTHNVLALARELGASDEVSEGLELLEDDYMTVRYPDVAIARGSPEYGEVIGQSRLAMAKRIEQWVQEQIGEDDAQ